MNLSEEMLEELLEAGSFKEHKSLLDLADKISNTMRDLSEEFMNLAKSEARPRIRSKLVESSATIKNAMRFNEQLRKI